MPNWISHEFLRRRCWTGEGPWGTGAKLYQHLPVLLLGLGFHGNLAPPSLQVAPTRDFQDGNVHFGSCHTQKHHFKVNIFTFSPGGPSSPGNPWNANIAESYRSYSESHELHFFFVLSSFIAYIIAALSFVPVRTTRAWITLSRHTWLILYQSSCFVISRRFCVSLYADSPLGPMVHSFQVVLVRRPSRDLPGMSTQHLNTGR